MNKLDYLGLLIASIAAVLMGIGMLRIDGRVEALESHQPTSVLVGSGCEGGSYIAVATEEDLLPRCAMIERHDVAGSQRP